MREFHSAIKAALNARIEELEKKLKTDVLSIFGPIGPYLEYAFPSILERLVRQTEKDELSIILDTPGGSAETVEKLVSIIRYHFNFVNFIVPNQAMSAGTIFVMSGDKIYMDYSSSLGPIDPQVWNGSNWVPAMGYLDKFEELKKKLSGNDINEAEFAFFCKKFDLGEISLFEQQKELTTTLLKNWLVKYKFKDWIEHETSPQLKGELVSAQEKEKRAEEIAEKLKDHKTWHSHSRRIDIKTLKDNPIRLKINDYSSNEQLKDSIRRYFDMMLDYVSQNSVSNFVHHKHFFPGE